MASELWWVSVGGNECEPARVEDGVVFTIGCPDGFNLGIGVTLVEQITHVPLTPEKSKAKKVAFERKLKRDAARGIVHGYRRFT